MRLVLLSDTHDAHAHIPPVPEGDVLVHAGDLTTDGTIPQLARAFQWLAALPHRHKVVIAGNHDFAFERTPGIARTLVPPGVTYLEDSGVVVEGLRIWGSPWQPEFGGYAFNRPRGEPLAAVWARIPPDVQVLVTHGPPRGLLDDGAHEGKPLGCDDLKRRVAQLPDLRLHVFGHIHEGYGAVRCGGVQYVNASAMDERLQPVHPAVVVDL